MRRAAVIVLIFLPILVAWIVYSVAKVKYPAATTSWIIVPITLGTLLAQYGWMKLLDAVSKKLGWTPETRDSQDV